MVGPGNVIADGFRHIAAKEDRARVGDRVEGLTEVRGVDLEVLGTVGVADGGRGREVVDQDDRRLGPGEGLRHALGVARGGGLGCELGAHAVGELLRVGDQHGGGDLVVLGLADEVGGDEAGIRVLVGDDQDLGGSGFRVDERISYRPSGMPTTPRTRRLAAAT